MRSIRDFVRRPAGWLTAGVIVLVIAGLVAWRASSQRPRYITATVTRGAIQRSISMTGALNPVVTVQVGSYVSGTVKSLGCDFNTEVVVGTVCATIDPVPFQLIVDQDKAEVGTSTAQLKKDEAALLYAKIAWERDSKLVSEGTVSQDTVDSEKSVYDQAIAQVNLDKASIVDKEAALKAAQVNLNYTNIVSPVVGTVVTRSIDVGQTVAASLQSPTLFLIGKDLTHMQDDTNVSESDVGDVRVGQAAYFTVQAFPGKIFHGKVSQIRHGPITVQNVVTYDVVIAVPNPDRALFPGMTADTHIVIDEHDDVLHVPLPAVRFNPEGLRGGSHPPAKTERAVESEGEGKAANAAPASERAAVSSDRGGSKNWSGHKSGQGGQGRGARQRQNRSQVWVLLDNGKLKAVPVTMGLDDGAQIEVSGEGLKPGDKVVVNEITSDHKTDRPTPSSQNQAFRPPGPRL